MKSLPVLLCLLISFLLIGCKGGGPDVVGKWKGVADVPSGKEGGPMAAAAGKLMESMTLELKADKTFVMSMMFPLEGTWEQSGQTLTLKMTKIMGQDAATLKKQAEAAGKSTKGADEPMVMTISPDGKTLTMTAKDQAGSLKFARA